MIQVEKLLEEKTPNFMAKMPIIKRPAISLLKRLLHESEVNHFLELHREETGFDFIDKVLNHFNFAYQASQLDRRNIPAAGRVMIIANHPLGALDGLALLRLVGEIRPDVKIIANDMLAEFDALRDLVLPVDNLTAKTGRQQLKAILDCLHEESAVIIFPAGEVSRISPSGVKDQKWSQSYLKLAQKTNSPLLPVYISGRNSVLFYTSSVIYRPLSTIQLANEMFRQRNRRIGIQIGQPIPIQEVAKLPLSDKEKNKLVKRHLYRIAKNKKPLLKTEKTVAHPQNRQLIKQELNQSELLGESKDGKLIYLFDYHKSSQSSDQNNGQRSSAQSATMQEIGRLREIAFRQVGEGTGEDIDLDKFDHFYRHLVLWDDEELEIVGAYRIGEASKLSSSHSLYSKELFNYSKEMQPYFDKGIELGRSFVQPKYWGKRSLDYLWYGIGAYLNKHPDIRYLFGPVSLSNNYAPLAKDLIVSFYQLHFPDKDQLGKSFTPYQITPENKALIRNLFKGESYEEDFRELKTQLSYLNASVPTLYKQYSELCEAGGVRFLDFGVDADFGYCIDGLVLVDLEKVKASKNARYRGSKTD
ncbi:GNAT family N-acetyltransferase [Marinomonas agarivorans]|nr:GNAT family N-acetyltransferase [Marinomonas agarivorans]